MLKIFKKKSPADMLQRQYEKLMKQSFELSAINRVESDMKYAEAQKVLTLLKDVVRAH